MPRPPDPDLQLSYARLVDWAAKLGFVLLVCTFLIYLTGLLAPDVPLGRMSQLWHLSLPYYLQATGIEPGWNWLQRLHQGDFLNFLPIALLAGVVLLGYLLISVKFFRQREPIFGLMTLVQVAILALAASGVLRVGGP
jgi:hypothetical protein